MAAGPQRPQQRRALEAAEGGGAILRDTEKQTHGAGVVLEAESGSISMRHNLRKRKRPIPSSAVWATHTRGDNADAHRHNAVMSSERFASPRAGRGRLGQQGEIVRVHCHSLPLVWLE